MELTILLSKILGVYMLIAGLAVLMNRRHLMAGIVAMAKERFAQIMAGIIALLFGLVLVNIHNDWSTLPASIVSLIGWAALVKGLFYLFMPEKGLTKLMHALTERSWYLIDGIVILVAGLYLAGYGYGWF